MSKFIVTFDKSNEDIPTLIVGKESGFLTPSIDIVRVITGFDAERIWSELSGQKVELKVMHEDAIKGSRATGK